MRERAFESLGPKQHNHIFVASKSGRVCTRSGRQNAPNYDFPYKNGEICTIQAL